MKKEVYIIVLNWNGAGDAIECIDSIKKIDYDNYKIAVVDNGSIDDSILEIKKRFPEIVIIENKVNLGFAGGNNAGIDYAMKKGADYILLLNNDTIVDKSFLSELVKIGESDKKNGLLEPKIYFYNEPDRIWFAGGKINWFKNRGTHIGLNEIDKGRFDDVKECDFLTGCCVLIKKEVIKKIGKMSEDYFLYYEDVDFSLRAKDAGYKCLYAPKAKIYHKVSKSTKAGSPAYIYYHTRNGLLLSKRNGSMLIKILLYPYCLFLFLKQIIKILFIPSKKDWAYAVLKGEKDFLLGKTGKIDL